MKIELWQGDCLELMKQIPDGSVDMVLTDPPYGTTACKWDTVIPFEPMWEQLKRITKKNGAICLFGSEPFSSALRMSNIKKYRYDWTWRKNSPTLFQHAKNRPLQISENISIFSEYGWGHKSQMGEKRLAYFPQGISEIGEKTWKNLSHGKYIGTRPNQVGNKYIATTGYPNNILEFKRDSKGVHPTQKPVALMEYLIKTYTNEGETVLDFTMGSGTTGVACKNLGRSFIGIELDPGYFEIAKKRIEGENHGENNQI